MNTEITTKFKMNKPAKEVFEAIVNPTLIGNYWFSSGSARWEQGKDITLKYDEYGAEVVIHVLEVMENQKIVFSWGAEPNETVVTMTLHETDPAVTIIEVNEAGFKEEDPHIVQTLLNQKEGWVYMLSCLKVYLEHDVKDLRATLVF